MQARRGANSSTPSPLDLSLPLTSYPVDCEALELETSTHTALTAAPAAAAALLPPTGRHQAPLRVKLTPALFGMGGMHDAWAPALTADLNATVSPWLAGLSDEEATEVSARCRPLARLARAAPLRPRCAPSAFAQTHRPPAPHREPPPFPPPLQALHRHFSNYLTDVSTAALLATPASVAAVCDSIATRHATLQAAVAPGGSSLVVCADTGLLSLLGE